MCTPTTPENHPALLASPRPQATLDFASNMPDNECKSPSQLQSPSRKRPKTNHDDDDDGSDTRRRRGAGRRCFVTIGATAGFRQLLEEIIQPEFLQCLNSYGYSTLEVQCGPDCEWFAAQVEALPYKHGIEILFFQYTKNMQYHMIQCRGEMGVRPAGCIISHAGSGTILEALRYQAPLVVVPNPTLMDNHQAELAEECEKQNWAVYGILGELTTAIQRSHERIVQGRLNDLAPYTPAPFPVPESQRVTLFDWMVLTCYPEELKRQQHLRDLGMVEDSFEQEKQQAAAALQQQTTELEKNDHSRLQVD
ncbi:hypothetical protein B0H63DRAFT_475234 [Podospora didyma]|uniref:UDP-N-acetylglucosamine transferase subunit ALG13 n=1 Tax=Podospora didyma TaxID=330526 RepID=A0AAE0TVV5_9PEZI|nr:hypothetical protein B0H63DRAFT_475234 [Podospora didyma]